MSNEGMDSTNESNNVESLRALLFDALKGLKNGTMDVEKAKAMSDVAQTIINTAKVEVAYAAATGASGSNFLEMSPVKTPPGALPNGITGVRVHRIKG